LSNFLTIRSFNSQIYSGVPRKLCEKKQPYGIVCRKQNDKRDLEKLCEKKKQQRSSAMALSRRLEEILWKSYMRGTRKVF
jgi:hypothetical protein